jgi:nucleotide sugar dehydrogenase
MSLKLAFQAVVTERTGHPPALEPPRAPAADSSSLAPVEQPDITELALAMGTLARPAAPEPAAEEDLDSELAVGEIALAMGARAGALAMGARTEALAAAETLIAESPAFAEPRPEELPVVTEPDRSEPEALEPAPYEQPPVEDDAIALDEPAPPDRAPDPEPDPADHVPARTLERDVVAVVGLRAVGLPTAIALRSADARVIGIDGSTSRLEEIRTGSPELLSSERRLLRSHLADGGFTLTEEIQTLAAAEYVVICVPTAVVAERRPSPEPLRRTCAAIAEHARPGQTFVLTSTTHVGGTRELLVAPLEERGLRVGEDVFVAFAPERSDPGVAEHAGMRTTRVLGAVTNQCYLRAARVLEPICREIHRVSSPEAAEMVKLYESTFRAVNIALAFEVADACRAQGLDPIEVTDAAATKPFGFMAHYPSAGAGGCCVGVDPHHLAEPLRGGGRPPTITEEALRKLASRPRQIVWRAQELLVRTGGQLSGARILVVGAAYKPGIADCRESPAVEIISRLQAEGARVDYHDPLVPELQLGDEAISGVDPDPRRDASGFGPEDYDLAVLVTVHPDHDYGWLRRTPRVLDCTYRMHTGRERFLP